jgi:uncharacterized membrane protein
MSLSHTLADGLSTLPPPLVVLVLAFLPIVEVRASIPIAYLVYGMGLAPTFLISLVGNLLIVPVLFYALPAMELAARRWGALSRALDRLYAFTRRKESRKSERVEEASLFAIVALPLPGAGTWTAMITAHVFALGPRKAWPMIFLGALVECTIITVVVVTGAAAWQWLV